MRRLIFFGLLLASRAFGYEMEDITTIHFDLKDPKSGEVYYTGKEDITQDGANSRRETVYFDSKGQEVQRESVVYDRASLKVSSYEYKNALTGEESKMDSTDGGAKLMHREAEGRKSKEATLKVDRNSFHGKVVNYLILRNWKALNNNKIFKFNLIIPSRLETIAFQIVHRRSYVKDGENREVFALIPQNVLIRTLAPHLEFEFNASEKPLAKQVLCPSPLPIKGQKDKMVHIAFRYPQFEKGSEAGARPPEAEVKAPAPEAKAPAPEAKAPDADAKAPEGESKAPSDKKAKASKSKASNGKDAQASNDNEAQASSDKEAKASKGKETKAPNGKAKASNDKEAKASNDKETPASAAK